MNTYDRWNTGILSVASLTFVGIWIYAIIERSHYMYDFFFIMALLVGLFVFRNKLALHPFHYGLFAIFLLSHDLGTFGFYEHSYLGIFWDDWVHSYFGLCAALILRRFYQFLHMYKSKFQIIAIIVVLLGLSALHELYEFAGAIVLGEGEGVLWLGAGDIDPWDAQKDMLNNVIGGSIGLFLYGVWHWIRGLKK